MNTFLPGINVRLIFDSDQKPEATVLLKSDMSDPTNITLAVVVSYNGVTLVAEITDAEFRAIEKQSPELLAKLAELTT